MAEGSKIQVTVKVRPLIKREKDAKLPKLWRVKGNYIQLVDATSSNDRFTFDHIFDEETTTREMFNTIAKPIVDATLTGFNGTIFAYGQTSSGKTHTMCGEDNQPGIMMMAVREIFNEIETMRDRQFLLRVGYIEIYNEKLYDLLDTTNVDLKIVEKTPRGEVTVTNKEYIVSNETIIMELLQQGNKERKTAGINMNERSSRSHTIFRIVIESSLSADQANEEERVVHTSYLNLVDLAGSERAVQTGATGSRLIEAGNINKSLLSLNLVISQLAEQSSHPDSFVNYRNSKLTRLLAASLGGNAMTAIICNVTPAALEETASTLNFAMSAKKVQNKPQVNEVCSDSVLMKQMMREIKRLNDELHETKNKSSMADLQKLKEKLFERESQILRAKPAKEALRRRTWAPSLATTDETQPLVNAHVSRILPPGVAQA